MKFLEKVSEKEYTSFVVNHEKSHFLQSYEWGQFAIKNKGTIPHYVGVVDDKNKLIATGLLLQTKLPFGFSHFYAPRGFVMDFRDKKVLGFLTQELKKYLKKYKAIYLRIDPDIKYHDIDLDANPVLGGENNYKLYDYLTTIGYKHQGFNKLYESNQPRYTFRIDLTTDELKKAHTYNTTFLNNIRKSRAYNLKLVVDNNIKTFHDLIKETASNDKFNEYGFNYYNDFYNVFNTGHSESKIYSLELNIQEQLIKLQEELEKLKKTIETNSKKTVLADAECRYNSISKKINKFAKYEDQKTIIVSSLITVAYGNKFWTMYLGNNLLAKETFAGVKNYYDVIEDVKNSEDYCIIDFFGTVGDPKTEYKNLAGIFEFKKRLGGEYIEFMGDFDLIVNKPLYVLYPIITKVTNKSKRLLKKLLKK